MKASEAWNFTILLVKNNCQFYPSMIPVYHNDEHVKITLRMHWWHASLGPTAL